MSAEEKQELKENSLARWARQAREAVASGSRSTWATLGIVVLVFVAVGVYYYVRHANLLFDSQLWKEVDTIGSVDTLEKLVKEQPNTWAGRVARMHLSRRALHTDGLSRLASLEKDTRAKAIANIESARTNYTALLKDVRDVPQLRAECLLQMAVAEEALVGVPKAESPSESRGDFEKAVKLYKQLADDRQLKDAFQSELARKHLEALQKPDADARGFYARLNEFVAKAEGRPADDFHAPLFPKFPPITPGGPTLPSIIPSPTPTPEATKKAG